MMSRLSVLALLCTASWVGLQGCPASFDPLPDDDSAADDDDSAADDDDTGDDDTMGSPIYESSSFDLEESAIYTVFLVGTDAADMNTRWVRDVSLLTTPDQHSVRVVHAAASQANPIDVYVDSWIPAGLGGLTPGDMWPDEFTEGYGNFGPPDSFDLDVYASNATPGVDPPIVEAFDANLSQGQHYTIVFTGRPQYRFLTQSTDDMSEITIQGKARLRIYHSVENEGLLDVYARVEGTGATLPLGLGMEIGAMGGSAMVDAGAITLRVYNGEE